jgi:uncharacterized protein (DUF2267 family)
MSASATHRQEVTIMNTSIAGFTHAANQAQQWVNELSDDLGCSEREAHRLLRAVLHALRDFLPQEEMADLAAQLPTLVRGIYFEGWQPDEAPAFDRSKDAFEDKVLEEMAFDRPRDIDAAISSVFRLLQDHLDEGELEQVRSSMKKALRRLWPEE